MPLIKETKLSISKMQSRVQTTAWVFIYAGLLTLIVGYTLGKMGVAGAEPRWITAKILLLAGGCATGVGVLLIYIRSLMH
jgi:hypothetical protein